MPVEARFAAMGTTGLVAVMGGPRGLVEDGVARIHDLERRWTRFRDDSELSRLNATRRGVPTCVSAETYRLVDRAVAAWVMTAGRYDPTVYDAVVACGYDRSFEQIAACQNGPAAAAEPSPGCSAIALDPVARTVALPDGVRIDPGGIGKGLAADIVAEELCALGADGVLVDIGGDIRAEGCGPYERAWVVDVAHPWHAHTALLHIALTDAGIATSSTLRRRWRRGPLAMHHIIDPVTGFPATTRLVAATAIAREAWRAEVATKATLVAGRVDASNDVSIVGVDGAGGVVGNRELADLVSGSAARAGGAVAAAREGRVGVVQAVT